VKGTFICSKAVLPHMKKQKNGRIVNVGSRAAVVPEAGMAAYSIAKAGVVAFTQALAEEVLADNITVNAVLPSTIDTAANRADMPNADPRKWVQSESLAGVIAFLCSDDASDISGAALPVYGKS
jgi:NAD(P)-dependent dehydrogenase (short-subunit alcohol dehydrogenase family)